MLLTFREKMMKCDARGRWLKVEDLRWIDPERNASIGRSHPPRLQVSVGVADLLHEHVGCWSHHHPLVADNVEEKQTGVPFWRGILISEQDLTARLKGSR